ncbi:uncharacterized protein PGTG_16031 [Puccinia graminis f. sp. tritici CRL 75-36-700-3]|uniref:Uncharacterized protein n=1 Tax=Puccinia graminis f. sp. tritici (strain CRL 75-36-700-3 / race SCCL) TaxID=418459 RepID=E3L1L9_PUCGT|nr:uncharacterized protein PGTG_16031 [Puccinia graminis f. sp. tritici CRL 75-36-700-3]EFP90444.1 hypothetical protein PGTG_16031 [Puccinia graminis f. sp. tritici CRL 75-36-700-3]
MGLLATAYSTKALALPNRHLAISCSTKASRRSNGAQVTAIIHVPRATLASIGGIRPTKRGASSTEPTAGPKASRCASCEGTIPAGFIGAISSIPVPK